MSLNEVGPEITSESPEELTNVTVLFPLPYNSWSSAAILSRIFASGLLIVSELISASSLTPLKTLEILIPV